MRIALDIDGTLGYRNAHVYMKRCNEVLNLNISAETLQDSVSLAVFYQLPEVLAFKESIDASHYRKAIGWIDYDPEVLQTMHLFPGVIEGVALLNQHVGNVTYYTARYSRESPERSQNMATATLTWLDAHDFVNPTSTLFCDGLTGKLRQIAQDIVCHKEPILLIDDQYRRLLASLESLEEDLAQVLHRHTLYNLAQSGRFRQRESLLQW